MEDIINEFIKQGDIAKNIIPSKEDINRITNKIKENKELDSYDLLILEKIKDWNYILKNKGERI